MRKNLINSWTCYQVPLFSKSHMIIILTLYVTRHFCEKKVILVSGPDNLVKNYDFKAILIETIDLPLSTLHIKIIDSTVL